MRIQNYEIKRLDSAIFGVIEHGKTEKDGKPYERTVAYVNDLWGGLFWLQRNADILADNNQSLLDQIYQGQQRIEKAIMELKG